jgi:hypothetical protein
MIMRKIMDSIVQKLTVKTNMSFDISPSNLCKAVNVLKVGTGGLLPK